jgi:REP element-mobilizing transposase RayT
MPDHVRLLVSASPKRAPHRIMHRIKGYRSNVLRDEYLVLRQAAESVDAVILVFDGWQCLFGNHQGYIENQTEKGHSAHR